MYKKNIFWPPLDRERGSCCLCLIINTLQSPVLIFAFLTILNVEIYNRTNTHIHTQTQTQTRTRVNPTPPTSTEKNVFQLFLPSSGSCHFCFLPTSTGQPCLFCGRGRRWRNCCRPCASSSTIIQLQQRRVQSSQARSRPLGRAPR